MFYRNFILNIFHDVLDIVHPDTFVHGGCIGKLLRVGVGNIDSKKLHNIASLKRSDAG